MSAVARSPAHDAESRVVGMAGRGGSQGVQIVAVDPAERSRIDAAIRLARANKRWLGLMPDQGFDERAAKGTLLIAHERGEVRGYLLYDLPRNEVKVIHLCVDPASRCSGIARALVDRLCERHPQRSAVVVRCRRDFPAHGAWPGLGFTPLNDSPGRSASSRATAPSV